MYLITNLVNKKVYVGQTWCGVRTRWKGHLRDSRVRPKLYISRAIQKYGRENFSVELLQEVQTQKELDKAEESWIYFLGSSEVGYGYNLTSGGRGGLPTESVRVENSKRMKVFWKDPEFRNKMLSSQKEIINSLEFRENLSRALKAAWSSPERKKKRSDITSNCWKNPDYRENMLGHVTDPKKRAAHSQFMKNNWTSRKEKGYQLPFLTDKQVALLWGLDLVSKMNTGDLIYPEDLGAYNHSYHAKALKAMCIKGLVSQERKHERGRFFYKVTEKGIWVIGRLAKGDTVQEVAKILGDHVSTVEKHYAPFTERLQERVRKILDSEAA